MKKSTNENWVDPMVGFATQFDFAPRWTLTGLAEIGGFGIGSDLTWGLMAAAQYAVNDTVAFTFGYRHLYVDYDQNGFVYDVTQSGPMLGATFNF